MDVNNEFLKLPYTLRWCEPFGGWGDHMNVDNLQTAQNSINDTGLCNRILHWEIGYYLSELTNYKYKVIVKDVHWPETYILDIPNTIVDFNKFITQNKNLDTRLSDLAFKTVFSTGTGKTFISSELNLSNIKTIIEYPKLLSKNNHWYSNFGYSTLANYINIQKEDRPLRKVVFKHTFIQDYIQSNVKDLVGIHIRRGNGVFKTPADYQSMPDAIKDGVENYTNLETTQPYYRYLDDNVYFNIIDSILKINPKQKFYLSYDLPVEYMQHFRNRYGDSIIDKTYLYNKVEELLKGDKSLDIQFLELYGYVISNLIDLFALSYTKLKLLSIRISTWSNFCEIYTDSPHIYLDSSSLAKQIKLYQEC